MKYIISLCAILSLPQALAGPYIRAGISYDKTPEYYIFQNHETNIYRQSSNYIAEFSIGWKLEKIIGDGAIVTIDITAFEHKSDPLKSGDNDIIYESGLMGVGVEYEFW